VLFGMSIEYPLFGMAVFALFLLAMLAMV